MPTCCGVDELTPPNLNLLWKDAKSSLPDPGALRLLTILNPTSAGLLSLVGVGPGDPGLLTLAAVEAIRKSQVVAYPVAAPGNESMAASIAADWIRDDHQRLPLVFPMVEAAAPRQEAWNTASATLLSLVRAGQRVVLLCEGDSSLYASCSYVLLAIRQLWRDCPLNVIPGISSLSAAAAAGRWPLTLQEDQLLLRPCPEDADTLNRELDEAATHQRVLALLKLGKRWRWVREVLDHRNLLRDALFAERVGWTDQRISPAQDVAGERRPYFSLLLIRLRWPDVLP